MGLRMFSSLTLHQRTKNYNEQLDTCYTRMHRVTFSVHWQHLINRELYSRTCKVTEKIKRRLRFAGHCYRYKDEVASRTILWQPAHGLAKTARQAAA